MISTSFQFLVYNVALLMLLVFIVEQFTARWRPRSASLSRIPVGIAVGAIGIIVMQTHWKLSDGAIFDTRSILLSISGLFFGTVPTVIAMVITAAFRAYQGGVGVMTGILVILSTGTIGLLWRHRRSKELSRYTFLDFYVMGIVTHVVMLLLMLTFPRPLATAILSTVSLPVLVLYPLGTALIGMLMVRHLQKDGLLQTIRDERMKLKIITDHTSDWDYWVGPDRRFRYCSPSAERLTGYSPDAFFQDPELLQSVVHPDDLALFKEHQHHTDAHIPEEIDFRIVRKDGAVRWIAHSCLPIYDAAGTFLGTRGSNRDITEKKETEQKLERATAEMAALLEIANRSRTALLSVVEDQKIAREQLAQLNNDLERRVLERTAELERANKELEAFSYSVSHDLRAPLRAINGFSRILHDDYHALLPDDAKGLLTDIERNTKKMSILIDDLLELSRVSRRDLIRDVVDVQELFRSVYEELRHGQMPDAVTFCAEGLPPALGDHSLLRQVAANLLSNAIKFSSKTEHPAISVTGASKNGMVVYTVADNGDGFDQQYADKLFGVFQRLHRAEEFEGTGVGLAIVKRIIERHGGTVWAVSEKHHGAAFHFTLPSAGN